MHRIASVALVAGALLASPARAGTYGDGRSYVTGYFMLALDGVPAGIIEKMEGGDIVPEVVETPSADGFVVKKQLGNFHYEDLVLTTSVGNLHDVFWQWMKDSFDHKHSRKDGSITVVDHTNRAVSVRDFGSALIAEIDFPKWDDASNDPPRVTIRLRPQVVHDRPPTPDDARAVAAAPRRPHPPVSLVLCIDGIGCDHPLRAGAITALFPAPLAADAAPFPAEFSNLRFTVNDADMRWVRWYQEFVLNGVNEDAREKTGSLSYRSQPGRDLVTLELKHIGIFNITADPLANGDDKIHRVTVETYVEELGIARPCLLKCE